MGLGLKEFMYADGISELRLHRAKLKILLKIAAITTNCLGAVYMRAGTGGCLSCLYMEFFSTETGYVDVKGRFLSRLSENRIARVIP